MQTENKTRDRGKIPTRAELLTNYFRRLFLASNFLFGKRTKPANGSVFFDFLLLQP